MTNVCHTKHERLAWLSSIVTVVAYFGDVTHDFCDEEILRKTDEKHFISRSISPDWASTRGPRTSVRAPATRRWRTT